MGNKRVLIVGSARESGGGVSSVIRLMEKMPVWQEYGCYWLGTQIQRNYLWKLYYALKGNIIAFLIIWRYDIVHFHTVPDKNGLIIQLPILLFAKLWRRKVVMHIHMGNQLMNHTNNSLFVWCLKRADRIVLLAEKFKKMMVTDYGFRSDQLSVIYNACETRNYLPYENKDKTIIMAGYFDDNKAPDVLMKAVNHLIMTDKWNNDWRVILMGNGDVEKFKTICHNLQLDKVVTFPGYVTGKTKDDIWNKASIFCLCSHVEGFPMVVLEAWDYGIPVVTTPVGGLPDVIEEGKNSIVFDFDDFESLADKLYELMCDEELRITMSDYEQKFVQNSFSLSTVNGQLNNLYENL